MAEAKKGYSIWSMLVIMTLLAVWMAIPRRITDPQVSPPFLLFFVSHQMSLWMLIGVALWLVAGKKKWLMLTFGTLMALIWMPITMSVIETALTGKQANTLGEYLVRTTGFGEYYRFLFRSIFTGLGYDPN